MAVVVMVMIVIIIVVVVMVMVMVVVIILAAGKGFFFEAEAEDRPQGAASPLVTITGVCSSVIPARRPLTASRSSAEIRSDLETISRLAAAT